MSGDECPSRFWEILKDHPLGVRQHFPVRAYDIDFGKHVNNIVYVRWLEDLRFAILEAYCPLDEIMKEGVAPVLTETHIHYVKPIVISDRPMGRAWMTDLTDRRWTLQFEFLVNEDIVAKAQQVGCFISIAEGRRAPAPRRMKEAFGSGTEKPG